MPNNFFPDTEFNSSPCSFPPAGYEVGIDYDPSQYLQQNASSANESREKLKSLLGTLSPYDEVIIVTKTGKKVAVLCRYLGNQDVLNPPFNVTLIKRGTEASPSYYVTVDDGVVAEKLKTARVNEEALRYHKCTNHRVDGDLVEFPVDETSAIYVRVIEDQYGSIDTYGTEIVIGDRYSIKSLNYIPSTQAGEYMYKLAEIDVGVDSSYSLTYFLAGSHIYHESGLTCDVRLMTCSVFDGYYFTTPTQLLRMSFLSGSIVSVGEDETARPLSATVHEISVEHCT